MKLFKYAYELRWFNRRERILLNILRSTIVDEEDLVINIIDFNINYVE